MAGRSWEVPGLARRSFLRLSVAGAGAFGRFHEHDPGVQARLVALNANAVQELMAAFVPAMVEATPGGAARESGLDEEGVP